jgi:14-3-3 protein epsilon
MKNENNSSNNNIENTLDNLEKCSRSELIYMSRLYERAEKYDEMVECVNYFIKLNPKINIDERNILSAGYKNIITSKRYSWRYLFNQIKKEEKNKNNLATMYINEIKNKVEEEIKKICKDIFSLLDNHLIPSTEDPEFKVYFLKLKADYFRYLCEFTKDEEFDSSLLGAEKSYKEAHEIAEKTLPISSTTRLGTALNYSVLLFEIKNLREEASKIAKSALDEGLKILDDLEKNKQKDTILIIQLLMENLILWNSEEKDDMFQ